MTAFGHLRAGSTTPPNRFSADDVWRYTTTFALEAGDDERVDLVCAGLDTIAEIQLNGEPVASTANMHRSYRFDVTRFLRDTNLARNTNIRTCRCERVWVGGVRVGGVAHSGGG